MSTRSARRARRRYVPRHAGPPPQRGTHRGITVAGGAGLAVVALVAFPIAGSEPVPASAAASTAEPTPPAAPTELLPLTGAARGSVSLLPAADASSTAAENTTAATAATTAAAQARAQAEVAGGAVPSSALTTSGIPSVALDAYHRAAALAPANCHLDWSLLAAIGRVESNHGRFGGASLGADGRSTPRVLGPVLDGAGLARIGDTDGGRFDGDTVYDRAVGPMQFIPSTWAHYGVDADGDGVADPFDIFDAAAAAGRYLCVAGGDLSTTAGQARAVLAYNHSDSYVATVLTLAAAYAGGRVPTLPVGPLPAPTIAPVDPAAPPALAELPPGVSLDPSAPTLQAAAPVGPLATLAATPTPGTSTPATPTPTTPDTTTPAPTPATPTPATPTPATPTPDPTTPAPTPNPTTPAPTPDPTTPAPTPNPTTPAPTPNPTTPAPTPNPTTPAPPPPTTSAPPPVPTTPPPPPPPPPTTSASVSPSAAALAASSCPALPAVVVDVVNDTGNPAVASDVTARLQSAGMTIGSVTGGSGATTSSLSYPAAAAASAQRLASALGLPAADLKPAAVGHLTLVFGGSGAGALQAAVDRVSCPA